MITKVNYNRLSVILITDIKFFIFYLILSFNLQGSNVNAAWYLKNISAISIEEEVLFPSVIYLIIKNNYLIM